MFQVFIATITLLLRISLRIKTKGLMKIYNQNFKVKVVAKVNVVKDEDLYQNNSKNFNPKKTTTLNKSKTPNA
jgi:hypothetical protein